MKKDKIQQNILEEKIKLLFKNCGFNVPDQEEKVPLEGGKKHRSVEVSAQFGQGDSLKILVECKGGKQKNLTISTLVHDYEIIKKQASADKVIFVIPDKEVTDEDCEYIEMKGMALWNAKKLDYYESLADAIKEYARYEIIHSLGLRTKEQSNVYNVIALKISQPFISKTLNNSYEIFLLSITPENLLKTAVVFRKASQENKEAFQRMLKKERLLEIGKYVSKLDSSLPTDIVVSLPNKVEVQDMELPKETSHLSDSDRVKLVRLSIPLEYASLEIIDGQHRLFGFVYTDDTVRKKFNLVVTGLRGIDAARKKQLFIDINEKAKKLDPNLLTYLSYNDNENVCKNNAKLMAIKIVMELNKTTPFKGRIRYLETGDEIITLKGFSAYDLRTLIGSKGALRRFNKNNSSEKYIKALRIYFSIISKLFKNEWSNPEKYIIATNRGITAFLKLLNPLITITKPKRVLSQLKIESYLKELKNFSSWETKHLRGQYIGAAGWKKFYDDLQKTIRKKYKKFGKV